VAILDVNRVETSGYFVSPILFNYTSGVLLDSEVFGMVTMKSAAF
jgi:hypothetical protein